MSFLPFALAPPQYFSRAKNEEGLFVDLSPPLPPAGAFPSPSLAPLALARLPLRLRLRLRPPGARVVFGVGWPEGKLVSPPPKAESGVGCADGKPMSSESSLSPLETAGRTSWVRLEPLPRLEPAATAAAALPPSVDEWSDSGVRGELPVAESCAVPSDRGDPDIIDSKEVEPDLVPKLSRDFSLPPSSEADLDRLLRSSSKCGGKATRTFESSSRSSRPCRSCWCCRGEDMPLPHTPSTAVADFSGSNPGGASSFRAEALYAPELVGSRLCTGKLQNYDIGRKKRSVVC